MKDVLYFYLEPYVYIKEGENGLILVNLLADKIFTFKDPRSIEIAHDLMSSGRRTAIIIEEDRQSLLIKKSLENFMGDIITSKAQPFLFDSEINILSGIDAYQKTIPYSRYNIGNYISNCIILSNMADQDCLNYIRYIFGLDIIPENLISGTSNLLNKSELDKYIQEVININPNIQLNLCGVNLHLLDYILCIYPNVSVNPIVSVHTLESNPDLLNYIRGKQLRYTLLIDLSYDKYDTFKNDKQCTMYAKITNIQEFDIANNLLKSDCSILFCPVLTYENQLFIKSLSIY